MADDRSNHVLWSVMRLFMLMVCACVVTVVAAAASGASNATAVSPNRYASAIDRLMCKELLIVGFHATWVDVLGLNQLWGENPFRRVLHHLTRNSWNPCKTPWIKYLPQRLNSRQIETLMALQENMDTHGVATSFIAPFLSKVFGAQLSKKASCYFNDFDEVAQKRLDAIGEELKPELEKLAGKPLTLGTSNFRCCIVRYEGPKSGFAW